VSVCIVLCNSQKIDRVKTEREKNNYNQINKTICKNNIRIKNPNAILNKLATRAIYVGQLANFSYYLVR
jgi:hypothetical protein